MNFCVGPVYSYYLGFFGNYDHGDSVVSILLRCETQVEYFVEAPSMGYYHNGTLFASEEIILYLPSSTYTSIITLS